VSHKLHFAVGATAPGGNTIKSIVGQSDTVLVYKAEDGPRQDKLCYYIHQDDVTASSGASLREFDDVQSLAVRVYPKADWPLVQDELGSALFNALTADSEEAALKAFGPARARIQRLAANRTRVHYAMASSLAMAVLALIGYAVYEFHPDGELQIYGACILFASLGAFASVALRIASVPVDPLESGWVIRYQGASRILMGVLFAAFLIAAAKANLVAGLVATSTAALLAYSFVCGFSERFVPEMLGGLEKSLLSTKGGRPAAAAHK
jgi:hypothetical protein